MFLISDPPVSYRPALWARLTFAVAVGLSACGFLLITRHFIPDWYTDFSALWNGARLLLSGQNPYDLIGPGRAIEYAYTLHYPASSLVAVIPFTLLSESASDLLFVFLSGALLAFGLTRENWDRVWVLPSVAFISGVRAGQFAPLMAAGYFLPWAAAALPVKPSTGLAVMASWTDKRVWLISGAVAFALLALSFTLQPDWLPQWIENTVGSGEYRSPIQRMGGFVLLLAALKWRQREARLLLALALIPSVSSWYEALLPMLVARTKRESQVLSLVSSFGFFLLVPVGLLSSNGEIAIPTVGNMMIAFAYLPALIVVLRRNDDTDGIIGTRRRTGLDAQASDSRNQSQYRHSKAVGLRLRSGIDSAHSLVTSLSFDFGSDLTLR